MSLEDRERAQRKLEEDELQETEHPLHRAARVLAEWAYTDSGLWLDRERLRDLLADDSVPHGRLPTDEQCMEFVCGDDTGEPPAQLKKDFPKTDAYLEKQWE